MKILLLVALVFSNITIAQENIERFYKKTIPEIGRNSSDIVIFYIFTKSEAAAQGVNWGWAENYNEYVVKLATKNYEGEKKFMTGEEIKNDIDFSEESYRFIFMPVSFRGVEFGRFWPDQFGVLDMDRGAIYQLNDWPKTSHSAECSSEIKFLEKSRLSNAGL